MLRASRLLALIGILSVGIGCNSNPSAPQTGAVQGVNSDTNIQVVTAQDGHDYVVATCTQGCSITHSEGCKECKNNR